MSQRLLDILQAAGIVSEAGSHLDWSWDCDLIPQLRPFHTKESDSDLGKGLDDAADCPHALRFIRGSQMSELLGDRLVSIRGMPDWTASDHGTRFLGIASSRVGRQLEDKSVWFRSLRAACVVAGQRNEVLLTSEGTAADRFVRRCEDLFGVTVCVVTVSKAKDIGVWFRTEVLQPNRYHTASILISPPLPSGPPSQDESTNASPVELAGELAPETSENQLKECDAAAIACPAADRALAALSDRLIILSARSGGNWDRLARWRTHSGRFESGATLLALGDRATTDKVRDRLLANGVVGWTVRGPGQFVDPRDQSPAFLASSASALPTNADRTQRDLQCHRFELGEFLAHCTRRRDGPWPNQSQQDYVDDLILERREADHSALAALSRITQMKCLLGSSESIHGDTPVVSFTAVPLDELEQLRVFRPHRGRWDFEPYGICIRRSWIQSQNGKPVRYASRDEWESMSMANRLFCHLDLTLTKAGNEIDWTVEQEWRVPGDLDLTNLSPNDAFVFVPTHDDARNIGRQCPWPIVALSELNRSKRLEERSQSGRNL